MMLQRLSKQSNSHNQSGRWSKEVSMQDFFQASGFKTLRGPGFNAPAETLIQKRFLKRFFSLCKQI